jgi:hypothetical protein
MFARCRLAVFVEVFDLLDVRRDVISWVGRRVGR